VKRALVVIGQEVEKTVQKTVTSALVIFPGKVEINCLEGGFHIDEKDSKWQRCDFEGRDG
jgi:hypothetical protein